MEEVIAEERGTELVAMAPPPESEEEQQLANEISELWAIHVQTKSVVKKTKEELKSIRERLSERLYEMKQLLARPGRNGQWSAWLKERKISRATADRLVQRFAATLPGYESPREATSNPPEDTAEKLAKGVWPRFRKVLTTQESIIRFLGCIAEISGIPHELREEGLVVFHAMPKTEDELPGSAPATGPAPHVSNEAGANAVEPAAQTVMATPANEDVAGIADASSGHLL